MNKLQSANALVLKRLEQRRRKLERARIEFWRAYRLAKELSAFDPEIEAMREELTEITIEGNFDDAQDFVIDRVEEAYQMMTDVDVRLEYEELHEDDEPEEPPPMEKL